MSDAKEVAEGQGGDEIDRLCALSDDEFLAHFAQARTLQTLEAIRVNRKGVLELLEPELSELIDSRIASSQHR